MLDLRAVVTVGGGAIGDFANITTVGSNTVIELDVDGMGSFVLGSDKTIELVG